MQVLTRFFFFEKSPPSPTDGLSDLPTDELPTGDVPLPNVIPTTVFPDVTHTHTDTFPIPALPTGL